MIVIGNYATLSSRVLLMLQLVWVVKVLNNSSFRYCIKHYQVCLFFGGHDTLFMLTISTDSEESVVAKVLGSLRTLAELGLFPRMRVWELMSATLALLYHPNIWIRQGT
jgi:hypothetical protein